MEKLYFTILRQDGPESSRFGIRVSAPGGFLRDYVSLSDDENEVRTLIDRLESTDLSVVHLDDVFIDFLYGKYDDLLRLNRLK